MRSRFPKMLLAICAAALTVCLRGEEEMTAAQIKSLPPPADKVISFAKDVKVILGHRCFDCHGNGKKKGGLDMSSRELLLKGGKTGPAVVSGKSSQSHLIKLVSGFDPDSIMPNKGERLTRDEIGILIAWIDQGLKWDEVSLAAKNKKADIKPRHPAVPAGTGNPIDLFLASYLAKNGVPSTAPVDDAVYARRVYMDTVGLLPPPQELHDFIADKSPGKREQLVKRLLAQEQGYADHWISFWSDLLRNGTTLAGIDGFANVNISGWLEKSLKTNVPYNQFVGALVNPTKETEAFIKGVRMRGVVPASQTPEMQAAQNISQVFLGVQIKCASCHDSFVSRWTLADSYGLASVLTDKPLELVRCEIPTGKTAEVRFLYPELGAIDGAAPRPQRMQRLAELITSKENGQFARTIVNRLWGRLLGRGLVDPVDEMENDPWHPELLDWLASDFADNGYDLRHTLELILTSRAYQMQSVPPGKEKKPGDTQFVFRGPRGRRMTAEQFVDAVKTLLSDPKRAWHDGTSPMMESLGRPDRNNVATTRDSDATTLQALEMINGPDMQKLIYDSPKIKDLVTETKASKNDLLTRWFMQGLGREPSANELKIADAAGGDKLSAETAADLLWVIVMLPEFQLIR